MDWLKDWWKGAELYKVKRVKLKLSFCGLIAREVEDKFSRKKLNLNFPQLSKKLYLVEVKKQLMVIVVPRCTASN